MDREGSRPPGLFPLKVESRVGFTEEAICADIQAALTRGLPEFRRWPVRKEPLLIVAAGPSVARLMAPIVVMQRQGAKVLAINGMHDWLIEQGVKPWGHLVMDNAPVTLNFVRDPRPGVIYFVASMTHPGVFDALDGYDVVLWHAYQGMGEEKIVRGHHERRAAITGEEPNWACLPGGKSAALRAPYLGYYAGFRDIHIYGLDCCFRDDRQHAYEPGISTQHGKTFEVWVGDRCFTTAPGLARQAESFRETADSWGALYPDCHLTLHGPGLCAAIAEEAGKIRDERQRGTGRTEAQA